MEKLIITCALTGAEVSRKDHPHLPITPDEIANAAYEAYLEGASIIHVHARLNDGTPTQDKEVYREILEKIRARCDAIVQISTGGAVGMSVKERMAPLALSPEMATLTAGTVNFGRDVFMNTPSDIEIFARMMKDRGVKPELEIFEVGMIHNSLQLLKQGLIQEPLHFDFVMGVPGGIPATPKNLLHLMESIPLGATWSVAGIGRFQLPMAILAVVLGGHVRVGFEDNLYYEKGILAQSNAQLVARVARIARESGREVANPQEARKILGLGLCS